MKTKFEVEKPFGKVYIEIIESEGETNIRCQIDDQEFNARYLDESKKALIFWTPHKIKVNGKIQKVDGLFLPNFDEVKAAFEAIENGRQEKAAAKKVQKIADIKSGKEKIKVCYHDGEYLSGYTVHGEEAELLKELKLCKYVDGWGYYIENELIKALGEEFTYEQAAEFAKPALDAKEAARAEKEAKRQAIFDKAKETGEKQLLCKWSDECNDPHEACSIDMVYEYAMPDGTTKIERYHTW